jgi:hypothetical protein
MPSFLWQGNLPNRASKIKRLLARHDIHLPRASGQVLSYTSEYIIYTCLTYLAFFVVKNVREIVKRSNAS